jgi:hypothetical protein
LDDGGATGTTKQAIKDEIYEITHRPEYMDDTKNKLLFARVTRSCCLRVKRFCYKWHFYLLLFKKLSFSFLIFF